MPHMPGADRLDKASRKWRDLAEKRLAYFVELYQSGRWQHYYTHERFAMRMLDVIKAAKTWGELAEQAPATKAVDRDRMRSAA
jgi:uncharacterized repeat protein (TIGR03809 family)